MGAADEDGEAVTGPALIGEEEGGGKVVVTQYFYPPELLAGIGEEDAGVVLLASPNWFAEIKVFIVEQTKIVELISVKVY